jgi:hypothetical protein
MISISEIRMQDLKVMLVVMILVVNSAAYVVARMDDGC